MYFYPCLEYAVGYSGKEKDCKKTEEGEEESSEEGSRYQESEGVCRKEIECHCVQDTTSLICINNDDFLNNSYIQVTIVGKIVLRVQSIYVQNKLNSTAKVLQKYDHCTCIVHVDAVSGYSNMSCTLEATKSASREVQCVSLYILYMYM